MVLQRIVIMEQNYYMRMFLGMHCMPEKPLFLFIIHELCLAFLVKCVAVVHASEALL